MIDNVDNMANDDDEDDDLNTTNYEKDITEDESVEMK
jgi:hypothetical protein